MKNDKDLQSFEAQLKKNLKKEKPTELAEFEAQLKQNNNTSSPNQIAPPGTKKIKVQKNLIISYVSDATGCGHIRNVFPMNFLNGLFAKSGKLLTIVTPFFIVQQDMLARARTLFFQRQMSPEHLASLQQYKKMQPQFKYKMVWEMDDFIWGLNEEQGGDKEDGVPSYNFGAKNITKEIKKSSVEIMKLMDTCTFSTQFLADYCKKTFKLDANCVCIPNVLPKFFWGEEQKPDITKKLKKPRVLYNGSPTHYHNVRKLKGDFKNSWYDWVIKSVKEDKIDFHVMGGLPWFFESIKDKVTMYDWIDSYRYHNLVKSVNADLAIMPLVPNNFNYGKSDLKYLEMTAIGAPAIGTVFTNGKTSPYDVCQLQMPDNCTVEDIDKMFNELLEPERYNEVKNAQYKWMEESGRWMEDPKYINHFANTLLAP